MLAEVVQHNEHLQGGAEAAVVGLPLLFTRRTRHTEQLGTQLYSSNNHDRVRDKCTFVLKF